MAKQPHNLYASRVMMAKFTCFCFCGPRANDDTSPSTPPWRILSNKDIMHYLFGVLERTKHCRCKDRLLASILSHQIWFRGTLFVFGLSPWCISERNVTVRCRFAAKHGGSLYGAMWWCLRSIHLRRPW